MCQRWLALKAHKDKSTNNNNSTVCTEMSQHACSCLVTAFSVPLHGKVNDGCIGTLTALCLLHRQGRGWGSNMHITLILGYSSLYRVPQEMGRRWKGTFRQSPWKGEGSVSGVSVWSVLYVFFFVFKSVGLLDMSVPNRQPIMPMPLCRASPRELPGCFCL